MRHEKIIGGHLRWRGQLGGLDFGRGALKALCYPRHCCDLPTVVESMAAYQAITPQQAAVAIRNFLTFGDPCWERVVAERRAET